MPGNDSFKSLGHGPPDARPEFYTCWINFCTQYNPDNKNRNGIGDHLE